MKNDVHIFDAYLENTVRGVPDGANTGAIPPDVWRYVASYYRKLGRLTSAAPPESGYTTRFFQACNAFDHAAIAATARNYGQ